jgi:hypothetical protein
MSGQHEKLRQALDDLQAQLAEMREVDPDVAAHLDTTIARAQAVLKTAPDSTAEHNTVSEQFSDALLHYEASHPTLAGTLRSVVDALGQIGI